MIFRLPTFYVKPFDYFRCFALSLYWNVMWLGMDLKEVIYDYFPNDRFLRAVVSAVKVEADGAFAGGIWAFAFALFDIPDAIGATAGGHVLILTDTTTVCGLVTLVGITVTGILTTLAGAGGILCQLHDGRANKLHRPTDVRQVHSLQR